MVLIDRGHFPQEDLLGEAYTKLRFGGFRTTRPLHIASKCSPPEVPQHGHAYHSENSVVSFLRVEPHQTMRKPT